MAPDGFFSGFTCGTCCRGCYSCKPGVAFIHLTDAMAGPLPWFNFDEIPGKALLHDLEDEIRERYRATLLALTIQTEWLASVARAVGMHRRKQRPRRRRRRWFSGRWRN